MIESATLGGIIHFIKYLKIGSFDVLKEVASAFNINQASNFEAYLEELNEIRNRSAHRERISLVPKLNLGTSEKVVW